MRLRPGLAASSLLVLSACADESELGRAGAALAVEGPWRIPEATLTAGDAQYVAYEGGGPWLGEEGCSGGLLPGTRLVGDYVAQRFTQVSLVGGYNCRPIRGTSETMSLHGAGRAVDLHVPTVGEPSDADNELGDQIGHFLIEHAELLGVQLIIWDEYSWGASRAEGDKGRDYSGVNPHHDHLHVELSAEAASRDHDWFSAALDAPGESDAGVSESDAGVHVPAEPDAGALPDAGQDDASPQPPDEPRDPAWPKPDSPKPIIEPVLDDDPLHDPDVSSVRPGPPVRGSTCSVRPHVTTYESHALLLTVALVGLVRRRSRRARRGHAEG
jgi:hypothetical protein